MSASDRAPPQRRFPLEPHACQPGLESHVQDRSRIVKGTFHSQIMSSREQLKLDRSRTAPLREIYPRLAEVYVEFEFEDGTTRAPSSTAYSYFPAANGFFRFSCPCYSCNGEFDLSAHVAELANETGRKQRTRRVQVSCTGLRVREMSVHEPCPVCARIRVSATPHASMEQVT
jgi:hypothetical protein